MAVNKDLFNKIIERRHYVQRFENTAVKNMVGYFRAAKIELMDQISILKGIGPETSNTYRMGVLQTKLNDVNLILMRASGRASKSLTADLFDLGSSEKTFNENILKGITRSIGISVSHIPLEQVARIVETPLGGMKFADRMFSNYGTATKLIKDELTQSVIQGEDMDKAAKRLLGLGEDLGGQVGAKIQHQSEVIARTEIQRVSNDVAYAAYKENSDVIKGVMITATLDPSTCLVCGSYDGEFYDFENNPLPEDMRPPFHPHCFIDYQIPIFTSKGYKWIGKIEVGDRVLTHRGRFRKVLEVIRHKVKEPKVVTVKVVFPVWQGNHGQEKALTMTDEHPVLLNGKWKYAKDIKVGDKIRYLASRCKRCGKLVPEDFKYCSHTCHSLDVTDRQWDDENHRKLMSKKASKQMKREYRNGSRDPFKITKAANKRMRVLMKRGMWDHLVPRFGDDNPARRLEVRKKISQSKMGDKNPSRMYPEIVAQAQEKRNKFFLEHPEKHPNYIMAQNGYVSSLERKMADSFKDIGLTGWVRQFPIRNFFVDFAFPKYKLAIECDGDYWHRDEEKDLKRAKRICKRGWTILRFSESEINSGSKGCAEEVKRVLKNHAGEYEFIEVEVVDVKNWISSRKGRWRNITSTNLYNLSVEGDESYVAKGFVVHNCRCALVPVTKSWAELGDKTIVEPPEGTRASFDGEPVSDVTNYFKWLSAKNSEDPDFVKGILGERRYNLWQNGQVTFDEMVKDDRLVSIKDLDILTGQVSEAPMTREGFYLQLTTEQRRAFAKINNWVITTKENNLADSTVQDIMKQMKMKLPDGRIIQGEAIVGSKPYDAMLANEFLEFKTVQHINSDVLKAGEDLTHQISMKRKQIETKMNWIKAYGGVGARKHLVAVVLDPRSKYYGRMFYSTEFRAWNLSSMTMLERGIGEGGIQELEQILLKGATKPALPKAITAVVPKFTSMKQAQVWAERNLAKTVDFGNRASLPIINDVARELKATMNALKLPRLNSIRFATLGEGEAALVSKNSRDIILNDKFFFSKIPVTGRNGVIGNPYENLRKTLERYYSKKMLTSDAGVAHVLRHEGAHVLWYDVGGSYELGNLKFNYEAGNRAMKKIAVAETNRIRDSWSVMVKEMRWQIGPTNFSNYVTEAALKNPAEFYAEMTARRLNGQLMHPVTTKVLRDVEKLVRNEARRYPLVIGKMDKVAKNPKWYQLLGTEAERKGKIKIAKPRFLLKLPEKRGIPFKPAKAVPVKVPKPRELKPIAKDLEIYVSKADTEVVSSWGDKYLVHKTSRETLQGTILEKDQLPPRLYHVTTNFDKVQETGILKSFHKFDEQVAGLGKGTSFAHQGISFTTDLKTAQMLEREMLRHGEIARGADVHDVLKMWAKQDEIAYGLREGSLDKAVDEAVGWIDKQRTFAVVGEKVFSPSYMKDAMNQYYTTRASISKIENPLFFTEISNFKNVTPKTVRIMYVNSKDIPAGVLIRDPSIGLKEIMVHSEVPVRPLELMKARNRATTAFTTKPRTQFGFVNEDELKKSISRAKKTVFTNVKVQTNVQKMPGFTYWEKKGVDPSKIIDDVSQEMERLTKKSPALKKYMSQHTIDLVVQPTDTIMSRQGKKLVDEGIIGGYNKKEGFVLASGKVELKERAFKLGKGIEVVGGDNVDQIMRHEVLGHNILDNNIEIARGWAKLNYELWDESAAKGLEYISDDGELTYFKKFVSNYAGRNIEEAFSETMAAYNSPYYMKGMLPKKLEDFARRVANGEFRAGGGGVRDWTMTPIWKPDVYTPSWSVKLTK